MLEKKKHFASIYIITLMSMSIILVTWTQLLRSPSNVFEGLYSCCWYYFFSDFCIYIILRRHHFSFYCQKTNFWKKKIGLPSHSIDHDKWDWPKYTIYNTVSKTAKLRSNAMTSTIHKSNESMITIVQNVNEHGNASTWSVSQSTICNGHWYQRFFYIKSNYPDRTYNLTHHFNKYS